jgi:hypothetical protein
MSVWFFLGRCIRIRRPRRTAHTLLLENWRSVSLLVESKEANEFRHQVPCARENATVCFPKMKKRIESISKRFDIRILEYDMTQDRYTANGNWEKKWGKFLRTWMLGKLQQAQYDVDVTNCQVIYRVSYTSYTLRVQTCNFNNEFTSLFDTWE